MFLLAPWSLAGTVRADKVFAQEKLFCGKSGMLVRGRKGDLFP